jgi:hypothetical protein
VLGIVRTEIVKQKEGIEQGDLAVSENAIQVHACAFECWFAFDHFLDLPGFCHG